MTLNRLARKMKLSWAKHSQCFYYAPNVIVINLYYLFMGCRVTSPSPPPSLPPPPTPLCRCHFTVLLYCIALNRFAGCLNAQSFSFSLALLILYILFFLVIYHRDLFMLISILLLQFIQYTKMIIIFNTRIRNRLCRANCAMDLWL